MSELNVTAPNNPPLDLSTVLPLVNLLTLNLAALDSTLSTLVARVSRSEKSGDLQSSLELCLEVAENCSRLFNQLARLVEETNPAAIGLLAKTTDSCLHLLHELYLAQAHFTFAGSSENLRSDSLATISDFLNRTGESFQGFLERERSLFNKEPRRHPIIFHPNHNTMASPLSA